MRSTAGNRPHKATPRSSETRRKPMQTADQAKRKPLYQSLYIQVLAGITIGIVLGYISPSLGISMKPFGDAFIKMIKMVIGLVIFCTVVAGMSGMSDMKKMGRLGGKALLYF